MILENITGERMDEVIYIYGGFIDDLPPSKIYYIWDVNMLPFPKEEILFVLKNAID